MAKERYICLPTKKKREDGRGYHVFFANTGQQFIQERPGTDPHVITVQEISSDERLLLTEDGWIEPKYYTFTWYKETRPVPTTDRTMYYLAYLLIFFVGMLVGFLTFIILG
jgi:hypothetical protein